MAEIQSLARGLKLLAQLGESTVGCSITETAQELGVDKGSASRLMNTLVKYGFAEKDQVSRRFYLGPQVVVLSRSLLTRMPLREVAKPFLRELMKNTGECAHIGVLSQGKVLYIDQVESPASLRVNAEVGFMAPLHCTALGKVLIAFGRQPILENLARFTDSTLVSQEALRKNLEMVLERGYAVDDEEFDVGVRCIAAPIYDFRNKAIGSIGISGPITRMIQSRMASLAEQVLVVSHQLSDKMKFSQSDT
ncbi:MAG: IclR family transcriptional regulator [Anaerolineaceae bacterium]|nr:IclR family transcriptional regulator [Anaerolineaceae bacterium]